MGIGAIESADLRVDLVRREGIETNACPASLIEVRQLAQRLLALAEPAKSQEPRLSARRLCHAVEVAEDVLDELIDGHRGGRCLVRLYPGYRTLAVLVCEVELGETNGDDGRGDEHHNDQRVFPDQAVMRPRGRDAMHSGLRFTYR